MLICASSLRTKNLIKSRTTMMPTSTRITPATTTSNPALQNEENILRINVDSPRNQNLATLVTNVALKYPTNVNRNFGRNEIIKKVYSGLLVNSVLVGGWAGICANVPPIRKFMRTTAVLIEVVFYSSIVIALGVGCLRRLAKQTVLNYILTAISVIFLGTLISYITGPRYNVDLLHDAISFGVIGGLLLLLSVIGVWNKFDLTKMSTAIGIIGFICGVIQLVILYFVNTNNGDLFLFIILSIFCFYFSIRLILDTQLIFGEGKCILFRDESVYGALLLLIDGSCIFALGRFAFFTALRIFV